MSAQIGKIIKGKGKNIKGITKNMSEIIEHNKRLGHANPTIEVCAPEAFLFVFKDLFIKIFVNFVFHAAAVGNAAHYERCARASIAGTEHALCERR